MRLFNSSFVLFPLLSAYLLLSSCSQTTNTIIYSPASSTAPEEEPSANTNTQISEAAEVEFSYPRTVKVGDASVVIHPPQITSWENFETIEGIAAIETVPVNNEDVRYGVVSFSADAIPDLDERTVLVENLQVVSITENNTELPLESRELFEESFKKANVLPLDLVLSHLSEGVISTSGPDIRAEPPLIHVSKRSAVLLLLHGEPVLVPLEDLQLKFVANTNWSLFLDDDSGNWFLRNDDSWLQAAEYQGPWSWAGELPGSLSNLPEDDNWRSTRAAAMQWSEAPKFDVPTVFVSTSPAELILLVGEANLVEIGNGLAYASNTDSQLFSYEDSWYYLVSGRWFTSGSLDGQWESISALPEVFATIPPDHVMANVLASVPGTIEAKIAVLDAQVPKRTTIPLETPLPETVSYTGEPEFVEIAGTDLKRAVNTAFDVIQVGDEFYLCYTGTWYKSDSANGPWSTATSIPVEIYTIPVSDPAYHTTYVKVVETTPTTVTYSYTAGYQNIYFYYGVPVYGTGWYYPPYFYYYGGYPVYYPYHYTYGSGSYYNSRTGAYGSVTTAYGPYGGWGYASAYNPSTGTYGRAEAVWDHDEWYAVGEAYNPSTGNYFGTERYYDADDGEWEINSTLQTQRGDVDISREFDADSGSATLTNDRGGEANFTRHASDGGWDTNGEFTTADGRTITSTGRYEDGRGTSTFIGSDGGTGTINRSIDADGINRQGTFTRDGQTLTTDTIRDGTNTRTTFETSGGGTGVITRDGLDDPTGIGQTGSGDVYATRDGEVYRKTDDGWEQRSDDGWSGIETPGSNGNDAVGQNFRNTENRTAVEDRSLNTQQRESLTNRSQNGLVNQNGRTSQNGLLNRNSGATQNGLISQNRSVDTRQRQSITNRSQSLNSQSMARQRGQSRTAQFQRQRSRGGFSRRR